MADPILPGRLGDPDMTLATDPRADPRMIAVFEAMEMAGPPEAPPVTAQSSAEELIEFYEIAEQGFEAMNEVLMAGLEPVEGVVSTVEVIRGIDGNDITLYVHRPEEAEGPMPGLLHLHGGGMVILEAGSPGYHRWRCELAATGMVVVGVEFRNGGGKLGPHPFPAGLNDCTSGLSWLIDNKSSLGVSKIIVSGESGGGNLTLATTMQAKRDGRLDEIAGVYAQCPYIYGGYDDPDPSLPSLIENDGYFLSNEMMAPMARAYDPSGENTNNPLAWPLNATVDDVAGFPPTVISVNELDPLRDEGLAFYRLLLAAGAPAMSRTVNGTCHAGDCIFRGAMPDVYLNTINDIANFAASV